jgi:ParB-like chromosome segregation protein Spo0J/N6-adenosine-specific RNA methylase IME4
MVTKTVPITAIRVGKRHRKDLGDIRSLAQSIQEIGLLHPVVIRPDRKLIAGERRLRALKLLGWTKVPVTVLDLDKVIRGEVAENVFRQDFRPSEMVAIARALEPILRREAKARQGTRTDLRENFPDVDGGRARDKLEKYVGVSGRTLEKMMAIVEAAEKHPRKFGHLKDEMDQKGKTSRPYRVLLRLKDEERILGLHPVAAKFRTLIIDPPWKYDQSLAGRERPPYATMTQEQLLCPTHPSMGRGKLPPVLLGDEFDDEEALELVDAWGFQQKSILTWVKDRWGLGTYFRNQTEHVIFAIRGSLDTRSDGLSTVFHAPQARDSEKPEETAECAPS